jgi:protein-disulfide isomerase
MAKRGKGKKRSGSSRTASGGADDAPSAKQSQREERRLQRLRQKRRQRILQFGALAVIVLAAAAAAFWPRPEAQGVGGDRLLLDPVIGPEDAPVTIVEFADFGCPSCRAWHLSGIKEQILSRYGDQVQFVWKDFPVITPISPAAARAGQCALDQGNEAFWVLHDLVYERGDHRESSMIAYTEELPQIDRVEFERCVQSRQHETTIEQDMTEARNLRLRGTPSFVVNGRVLPGPPRFEQLARIIEDELAARN